MDAISRRCALAACVVVGFAGISATDSADAADNPFRQLQQEIGAVSAQVEALAARIDDINVAPGPAAVTVDCNAGQSIASALQTPGAPLTVTVNGVCTEDVAIHRDDVTLVASAAGGGIAGTGPNTLLVRGDRVTVDGLAISGGTNGIVLVGADAFTIRNCSVGFAGSVGIVVFQGSQGTIEKCNIENNGTGVVVQSAAATIINNNISANRNIGINVLNNGAARIGTTNQSAPAGNIISNNGGIGIHVGFASAYVVANTISGNGVTGSGGGRFGINVFNGTADVVGNTITGNGGHGVQLISSQVLFGDAGFGPASNFISGNGVVVPGSAGIFADLASTMTVANTVVRQNTGSGIALALKSTARLFGTIVENTGDGVILQTGSAAEIGGDVSGNGGTGVRCLGPTTNANVFGSVTGNVGGNVDPACTPF